MPICTSTTAFLPQSEVAELNKRNAIELSTLFWFFLLICRNVWDIHGCTKITIKNQQCVNYYRIVVFIEIIMMTIEQKLRGFLQQINLREFSSNGCNSRVQDKNSVVKFVVTVKINVEFCSFVVIVIVSFWSTKIDRKL